MSVETARKIVIRLMPEYGAGSLWVSLDDGGFDVYDVDEITDIAPVSEGLLDALAAWDERFQATFNDAYPPDRIKGEVPSGVTVEYLADGPVHPGHNDQR
jgi:hypothetical protein